MSSRRAFLGLGAVGLAYWGLRSAGPDIWARYGPLPALSRDGMPEGFRKLEGTAQISGGIANPLIGLEQSDTAPLEPLTDSALCEALFAEVDPGKVTLNYFTDYNCAYCRVLGRELKEIAAARSQEVQLVYHELPLLGPGSVIGAQAALAARRQGAYDDMHRLLNTGIVRITNSYVRKIADELRLDLGKLQADMEGPGVARAIERTHQVAARFGVIGTPFLLVGRSAVYGSIDAAVLDRLVDLEFPRSASLAC